MFKVLLCIPPDYGYNFPPLGTPALCAFLNEQGISASQVDFNIQYRNFLLENIRDKDGCLGIKEKKPFLNAILQQFFLYRQKEKYYSAMLPRDSDRISAGLPYNNNTNSSFYFTERLLSSKHFFRYLSDEKENSFLDFYLRSNVLGRIEKASLLGISIISPSQVIPGLTLGLLVKKSLPHIHVNIGGQWPTLFRRQLIQRQDLFRCFDSVIVFEGETPLAALACAVKKKIRPRIPNVIVPGSLDDFSANHTEEDMNKLPCPDFSGLPLEEYEGVEENKAVLTYETSRGCYWSRCAYCVDLPLPRPSYRRKDHKLVCRDIRRLKKDFNAGYLMLGDPGLSARQMLEVAQELIKKRVSIKWWTMARLDPGFNRRIFSLAKKAGLEQINFGFESASDRLCRSFGKGNTRKNSLRVIKDCANSGIKVDLQTMLALPGETFSEGLETVKFLVENKKYISHASFNVYYLTPANLVYQSPEEYGISRKKNSRLAFCFFNPFTNINGMEETSAVLMVKLYEQMRYAKNNKSAAGETRELAKGMRLNKNVELKRLGFSLCREYFELGYLYQPKTREIMLLSSGEERIMRGIEKRKFRMPKGDKGLIAENFIRRAYNEGYLVGRV
jgi:radical SAM superfamily enzyme YgiQ (UPF0313 family)